MSTPRVWTMEEVYYALVKWGIPYSSVRLREATYVMPDLDWLHGRFFDWYKLDLEVQGLAEWGPDWNCNSFAWDISHTAQKSHKRRQRETGVFLAEGIGVFCIRLFINQAGMFGTHEFTLVGVERDGVLDFQALEPQPRAKMKEYNLTPSEKSTCTLLQ